MAESEQAQAAAGTLLQKPMVAADPGHASDHEHTEHRLQVRGLGVMFNGNYAIRNISMRFQDNRATAIIGPSGCGKSTMLRALN
ncbi:MAG: ATP-binding cassette domain-containing protein, partial [Candidatus Kapaibacterium sp.]